MGGGLATAQWWGWCVLHHYASCTWSAGTGPVVQRMKCLHLQHKRQLATKLQLRCLCKTVTGSSCCMFHTRLGPLDHSLSAPHARCCGYANCKRRARAARCGSRGHTLMVNGYAIALTSDVRAACASVAQSNRVVAALEASAAAALIVQAVVHGWDQ